MQSPLYIAGSTQAANPSLMTVQTVRAPGATTITTNTVAGVPTFFMGTMGAPHTFTDPVTGEVITIISEATAVDFAGTINAGKIDIVAIAPGYADTRGNAVGDIIVVRPTTQWADNLFNVINNQAINPAGMIAPFAGAAAPANWLLCDGSAVSRSTYAALFTVIGSTYGVGDGSTTFNVPDLRGRNPMGAGAARYVATVPAANINVASNLITISATDGKQLINGTPVVVSTSGTIPAGLTAGNTYYVIKISSTTIKLTSLPDFTATIDSVGYNPTTITSAGTGNLILTMTLNSHALAEAGGEETHIQTQAEVGNHVHMNGSASAAAGNLTANGNVVGGAGQDNVNGQRGLANLAQTTYRGGTVPFNVLNPYLSLNYIIKT